MTDNVLKSQAFKLKGRFYTLTVLQILDVDCDSFIQQLVHTIAQAPRLFDNTPVVLDCSAIDIEAFDLNRCCQSLREHGLFPVAVQGSHDGFFSTRAQALGLAVLHASSTHDKPLVLEQPIVSAQESFKAKTISTPVRSGQQIVNRESDLIITASVSHGAELLAGGNIHVYGALRGKALAGISGDKDARIFCQSLDAELVAIAGFYCVRETIEQCTTPCQIYLQDEQIRIEPL